MCYYYYIDLFCLNLKCFVPFFNSYYHLIDYLILFKYFWCKSFFCFFSNALTNQVLYFPFLTLFMIRPAKFKTAIFLHGFLQLKNLWVWGGEFQTSNYFFFIIVVLNLIGNWFVLVKLNIRYLKPKLYSIETYNGCMLSKISFLML